jgi:hypothetical protein
MYLHKRCTPSWPKLVVMMRPDHKNREFLEMLNTVSVDLRRNTLYLLGRWVSEAISRGTKDPTPPVTLTAMPICSWNNIPACAMQPTSVEICTRNCSKDGGVLRFVTTLSCKCVQTFRRQQACEAMVTTCTVSESRSPQ